MALCLFLQSRRWCVVVRDETEGGESRRLYGFNERRVVDEWTDGPNEWTNGPNERTNGPNEWINGPNGVSGRGVNGRDDPLASFFSSDSASGAAAMAASFAAWVSR